MGWLVPLAFLASAAAVRAFLGVSRRRFLDQPGERSSHTRATPTGGGFPTVLAFLAISGLAVERQWLAGGPRFWASASCALALALLGLGDDAWNLPRSARFIVQIAVAVLIVAWLGSPGPTAGLLGALARATAVVVVVGLINAFNFMDGMDALVAGSGCIILAFIGFRSGDGLWYLLAAAYAGFLTFNWPPARIFMGDAGSTVLGGLVGIALLSGRDRLAFCDLLVLAPLLGDSTYTIARRLLRRENVLRAHHSHLYQRLLRAGHSHGRISGGYALATASIGTLLVVFGDHGAALASVGCVAALVAIERYLAARGVPFTRPKPSGIP